MKQIIAIFCLIIVYGGSANEAKTVQAAPKETAMQALQHLRTSIDSLGRSTDHLLKCVE